MALALPSEKATKWCKILDTDIAAKAINHATLESLVGKLGFAQNAIYNRFARTQIQPLYAKLYSYPYYDRVHGLALRTLKWWSACLGSLSSRIIRIPSMYPDVILYTEASYEGGEGMLAAIFLDRYVSAQLIAKGAPPFLDKVYSIQAFPKASRFI